MPYDQQYVRVTYIIRRPPSPADDSKTAINARKIIQKIFGDRIVPFDLDHYNYITLENTGFRIRIDKHDYNSYRIDVNLKEEEDGNWLEIFASPTNLAFQCLEELEKANGGRPVNCYVSFELVSPDN